MFRIAVFAGFVEEVAGHDDGAEGREDQPGPEDDEAPCRGVRQIVCMDYCPAESVEAAHASEDDECYVVPLHSLIILSRLRISLLLLVSRPLSSKVEQSQSWSEQPEEGVEHQKPHEDYQYDDCLGVAHAAVASPFLSRGRLYDSAMAVVTMAENRIPVMLTWKAFFGVRLSAIPSPVGGTRFF